jgi:hypothetical protein
MFRRHEESSRGKRPASLATLLLAASLLLLVGCNVRPTLVGFNDLMAKHNQRLNEAGTRFNLAVNLALKNPTYLSQVDNAYADAKQTLENVKSSWESQKLPKHASQAAPGFMDAYKQFLTAQDAIAAHMDKIVTMLHDTNLDPAARQQTVFAELADMNTKDNVAKSALTSAQQKYSKEHNFQTKR